MSMTLKVNGRPVEIFDFSGFDIRKHKGSTTIKGCPSYSAKFTFFADKELTEYEKEIICRVICEEVRDFDKENGDAG